MAPRRRVQRFLIDGPDGPLVGKSYDWNDERGLVVVNKRGVIKRALVLSPGNAPARWTSRFASLTFNQYGRELAASMRPGSSRALTNSTYAKSLGALRRSCPSEPHARTKGSLERFACLKSLGTALPPGVDPVARVFGHLDGVRFPESTQWQIVYEPRLRRAHFRTRSHPAVKTVALDAFAPECSRLAMTLDLLTDRDGDVATAFVPYTEQANLALARATLAPLRRRLPSGIEERVAAHPRSLACAVE